MSDSPPEKDVQWSEEGIVSSFKFLQKLWNLHLKIIQEIKKNHEVDSDQEITKQTHKFIKIFTDNIEKFSYNKIIANLHEIYSFISKELNKKYKKNTLIENYQKILILMKPIIPHFANECLSMINISTNISWPSYDKNLIQEDNIKIVVQINGKKREIFEVKKKFK